LEKSIPRSKAAGQPYLPECYTDDEGTLREAEKDAMLDNLGLNCEVAINGWFAGDASTGSGQYINHLLAHLVQAAPAPRFSLLLPKRKVTADAPDLAAQKWPGVDIVRVPIPPLPRHLAKLWWEQVSVPHAAHRLGADVLWVPYWAAPYWQPVQTVVTIHDLIPLLLPAYRGSVLQRAYTRLVSRTAKRSAAVIAVSEAAKRDIVVHLGIPAERVFAVLHGTNQEGSTGPTPQQLAAVRQKYGLPERFFLYLGGFDVRKNINSTLQAYRRYLDRGGDPNVGMVIAGKLPPPASAFFPDPQKIAAELQLGASVHFCGWIDEAEKPALYALATAYIFPSLYEGFGMMVAEAMQAGAPVVTSAR
jgi:glycosyltransferase involved in cell wall biosynthesis